jgi:hypothetical protein
LRFEFWNDWLLRRRLPFTLATLAVPSTVITGTGAIFITVATGNVSTAAIILRANLITGLLGVVQTELKDASIPGVNSTTDRIPITVLIGSTADQTNPTSPFESATKATLTAIVVGSAFGTRSARIGIISTGPINTDRPTTAVDIMGTGRTKIGAWKTGGQIACVVPTCRFASELDTSPRSLTRAITVCLRAVKPVGAKCLIRARFIRNTTAAAVIVTSIIRDSNPGGTQVWIVGLTTAPTARMADPTHLKDISTGPTAGALFIGITGNRTHLSRLTRGGDALQTCFACIAALSTHTLGI